MRLIIFIRLNFKDGHLSKNISKLSDWINSFLSKVENIESMYVTAYEGGHQDHDALHVATVIASKKNNLKNKLFQFPLYNSYKCLKPFFAVLSPLPVNGEIIKIPISLKDRIKGTLFCLSYPSQIKTPTELGMGDKGTMKQLTYNIAGVIDYINILKIVLFYKMFCYCFVLVPTYVLSLFGKNFSVCLV